MVPAAEGSFLRLCFVSNLVPSAPAIAISPIYPLCPHSSTPFVLFFFSTALPPASHSTFSGRGSSAPSIPLLMCLCRLVLGARPGDDQFCDQAVLLSTI